VGVYIPPDYTFEALLLFALHRFARVHSGVEILYYDRLDGTGGAIAYDGSDQGMIDALVAAELGASRGRCWSTIKARDRGRPTCSS
jgi:hypothetical protein